MYSGVLVFFFLFSTQNQVPQISIGMGRVIYHIKALSIVIRTTSKNFKNFFNVEKNYSNFELIWCEHAGLQTLTLSRCTQISVVFGVFQRHFVNKG